MTREEVKNLLPVMQAFAEGKEIQYVNSEGRVSDKETMFDDVSYAFRYRIKPEPTYRPFRNTKECWAEMQKHQPFGWIMHKGHRYQIISMTDNATGVFFEDECDNPTITKYLNKGWTLMERCNYFPFTKYLNEGWTFVDGTPFGIKEDGTKTE